MNKMINKLRDKWTEKSKTASALTKHLVKSMAWNVVGTVASKMFVIIASIFVARILGVDKNGEYGVINSTVLMFSTFAGLGLGTTATRFTAEYRISDKERCSHIIGMTTLFGAISGLVMAIVLFIFAPSIASGLLNNAGIAKGLRIASILLITNTLTIIQNGILAGFEAFKSIAKVTIIQGLVSLPVFILFTLWLSVEGLIIGYIVTSLIAFVLLEIETRKMRKKEKIKRSFRHIRSELGTLWRFSLPSMLSGVVVAPVMWIGNAIITATANGYFQLGIFNAAYQWRNAITFIPIAVGNVILPAIVRNKSDKLERVNILLSWIIVNMIAIPLLAAPEFFGVLYGGNYIGREFNVTFLFIIIMCCFISFKEGIARNLIRHKLMWWGLLDNLLWGIIFIVGIWSLRTYGTIGMAISYFLAYLLTTIAFVPFYISRGIVSRKIFFSRWVLLMWLGLAIQLAASILTQNIAIRIIAMLSSVFVLCKVVRLIGKDDASSLNIEETPIEKE